MKFQNFDNNSYIKQWLKGREGGKITFDETAPTYPTDDERFQAEIHLLSFEMISCFG